MDTHPTPAARLRQHPLLIAAAIAVILFCAVGTAAIMGWLPTSSGGNRGQLLGGERGSGVGGNSGGCRHCTTNGSGSMGSGWPLTTSAF